MWFWKIWKNLRTWHNGVPVVPWYNLYITINIVFLSEKGNVLYCVLRFHISYSIFTWRAVGSIIAYVLAPQITSTLTPFILSIFSLSSYVSSSLSFVMSANYQGMRSSGMRRDSLEDENLSYCHRCHTKTALWCFSSLCVSVNVSVCHNLSRWNAGTITIPFFSPQLVQHQTVFQITAIWLFYDNAEYAVPFFVFSVFLLYIYNYLVKSTKYIYRLHTMSCYWESKR